MKNWIYSETKYQNWTQIVIDDPLFLPGNSIVNLIKLLLKTCSFKYIILDEIYGITEAIVNLEHHENIPLQIDEKIFSWINAVKQFDWGDFFLFEDFPSIGHLMIVLLVTLR